MPWHGQRHVPGAQRRRGIRPRRHRPSERLVTDRPPSRLSWLQPIPAPRPLPDGYDRHDPKAAEQRVALAAVLDGLDVVSVGYRGLVDGLLALGRTDIPLARLAE